MKTSPRTLFPLLALAAAAALAGCAMPGYQQPIGGSYPGGGVSSPAYAQYGRVTNVEFVRGGGASQGVGGAVVGGVVGGLAGHQIGGGSGRTAATIVGAVGGALIGNALERNMSGSGQDFYRVTVQLDNGSVRSFDYAQAPNVQVGERVRVEGNQLYR
ncbi:MAG TPA: glycine zipper 2TM domain-containing protein [Ottowia sp.]|uniref:glycine zipper 2TM domain-containing protein n=1 Tax=Ottowia sp. TaxID=1898956 RepID=UPI002C90E081|nr:glycine zipper 2TM domain-containing protein [Ottowia sp.]HMN22820.1 glycine zipper 2TM domain-containing protein [Ottowia sp.]